MLRPLANFEERGVRNEVILRVDGLSLYFKGLEEATLVLLDQSPSLIAFEQIFSDLSLQHDVLVEELDLVAEILPHNVSEKSHVCQVAPAFQDHLHFFRSKGRIVDALECGGI